MKSFSIVIIFSTLLLSNLSAASDSCPKIFYLGDNPSGSLPDWSNGAQGVANDDSHWFFSNKYHIIKYKKNWRPAIGNDHGRLMSRDIPGELKSNYGTNHFGDIDHYSGYIFVPFEGEKYIGRYSESAAKTYDSNKYKKQRYLLGEHVSKIPVVGKYIDMGLDKTLGFAGYDVWLYTAILGVFRASDLKFVDWVDITKFQSRLGWVAIDPIEKHLYTSLGHLRPGTPLLAYIIDYSKVENNQQGDFLNVGEYGPLKLDLLERDSSPLSGTYSYMQGGVFSPNGDLYISVGKSRDRPSSVNGGLHLFRRTLDGKAFRKLQSSKTVVIKRIILMLDLTTNTNQLTGLKNQKV